MKLSPPLNGWELKDVQSHLLDQTDELRAFVAQNPLASQHSSGQVLLIIRSYHPQMNCAPTEEDRDRPGLAVYTWTSYFYCYLPKNIRYREIRFCGNADEYARDTIRIVTDDGRTFETNMGELSQAFFHKPDATEAQLEEAFLGLKNQIPTPTRPRNFPPRIDSTVLGAIEKGTLAGWYEKKDFLVPFFDSSLSVIFNLDRSPTPELLKTFDDALARFLAKGAAEREALSEPVNRYCQEYLEAVGADLENDSWESERPMLQLSAAAEI